MLRKILRSAVLLLSGLLLAATALPDAAQARGGFYARGYGYGLLRPAYRPLAAIGLGVGFGYGYYGYPLDDSYDYPYGYGEYAEYGPWAYGGYVSGGCFLTQRRVRTASGPRWRAVRVCN
jgi:hypothetical protein